MRQNSIDIGSTHLVAKGLNSCTREVYTHAAHHAWTRGWCRLAMSFIHPWKQGAHVSITNEFVCISMTLGEVCSHVFMHACFVVGRAEMRVGGD